MEIDPKSTEDITQLLKKWSSGDRQVLDDLMPLVYSELKRQAARYLRNERPGHTLQTTALIHEAYLKLVDQRNVDWQNRAHFYGIAAQMMKRVLLDHAKARHRVKRGGAAENVDFDERLHVGSDEKRIDLIALDEALARLAKMDPRQAQIVELRYFGGLGVEDTAAFLQISPATVKRDWNSAKAWLKLEMGEPR